MPYVPGRVEARSYKRAGDATPMVTDAVETVGAAQSLTISPPANLPQKPKVLTANGVDVAFFHVSVVDAAGRVIPSASDEVTFTVSGPGAVVGTGNGDPASHVPDHSPKRPAYHGRVLGVVRADDASSAGELTVTASAPGLASASYTLPVAPATSQPPRL